MPFEDTNTERQLPRLLIVLRAVALNGPISLVQLNDSLDISRASIWRALDTLRKAGWVRMRLGDNAFELSHVVQNIALSARFSEPSVVRAVQLLRPLGESGDLHVQIGMFTATGQYQIVETTQKAAYEATSLSLTDDKIAIAGQLMLDSAALLRHVRAFMEMSSAEERRVVTSGEHARLLKKYKNQTVLWQEERDGACRFRVRGTSGWPFRSTCANRVAEASPNSRSKLPACLNVFR